MCTKCPECRREVDKNMLGIDRIAQDIINELEVFCPAEDCPWKVPILSIFRAKTKI